MSVLQEPGEHCKYRREASLTCSRMSLPRQRALGPEIANICLLFGTRAVIRLLVRALHLGWAGHCVYDDTMLLWSLIIYRGRWTVKDYKIVLGGKIQEGEEESNGSDGEGL